MTSNAAGTDVADILATLSSAEGQADPHPSWHRLRAIDPVLALPNGSLLVTGYREAREILSDGRWESLGDRAVAGARAARAAGETLDDTDLAGPVDAVAIRPVVSRCLSSAAMAARRDRVSAVITGLIDPLDGRDEIDTLADLAIRVPLTVLAALLGLPDEDRSLLFEWLTEASADSAPADDGEPTATVLSTVHRFMDYLDPLIVARRSQPTDDVLSDLLHALESNGYTEMDLRRFVLMFVIAAHETTSNLITNGVHALLSHPDQLDRLRADRSLVTTTVEEVMRWDGSVKAVVRYAAVDLELDGRNIEAGTEAAVALAAANRDPAEFTDPDRFDIARRPNPHLALAKGAHLCMGAALARIIGQETLWQLVTRFPEMTLLPPPPTYRQHLVARGFESLPVSLGRAN